MTPAKGRAPRRWLRLTLAAAGVGALVLLGSTDWLAAFGGGMKGERLERAKSSPNYRGGRFQNLVPTRTLLPGTVGKRLRTQFFGDETRVPERPVPIVQRGRAARLREPAPFRPASDLAVVSHDHYDHLDMATVRFLAARGTVFAVPLGVGAHLERWSVPEAQRIELDWGETARVGDLTLKASPARHYAGRLVVGDPTLWASWVIAGSHYRVYYSGDSGYFEEFRRVGERDGPFDLALIKIGAYGSTWPEIHMTAEEAVQTHLDVRGGLLLPVHWGTFNLAPHDWREPAERVLAAAGARGVRLVLPRPGEPIEPARAPEPAAWWREN